MLTSEAIAIFTSLLGLCGSLYVAIVKFYKFIKGFIDDHKIITESLHSIKKELTPNGGGSLKDIVSDLKMSASRIEMKQEVLEQRSRAALENSGKPMFETDNNGRLVWSTTQFQNLIKINFIDDHDWISLIDEDHRPSFIQEFRSCLEMNRRLDINTVSRNGEEIRFIGFPYKLCNGKNSGYLIHFHKIKTESLIE